MSEKIVKWLTNNVIGKSIYLNHSQCTDFDLEYFDNGSLDLPADAILRSRFNGYDRFHKNILQRLGTSNIKAERKAYKEGMPRREEDFYNGYDDPGWYCIIGVAHNEDINIED